jgi:hypothetical protein
VSIVKKTERPVFFPGISAWRASAGPVVDMGDIAPGDPERGVQGYRLYLNERELREAVIAWGPELLKSLESVVQGWGWASPEHYTQVVSDYEHLTETMLAHAGCSATSCGCRRS